VVAVGGVDFIGEDNIDHASVYSLDNLNHIANLDVGSTPLALAYDSIGNHMYISPTDVDDNGMFVIEYNIHTQLQTNYYQVAGLLGSHALVVDANGEYIYAAVDDLSDQDTDEPYNNSSFNIQRIKILPEGTFPHINNFY
jgi:DNA-binding beta-propeller fold protein YncE